MGGIPPPVAVTQPDAQLYIEAPISVILGMVPALISGLIVRCIISVDAFIGYGFGYDRLRRGKIFGEQGWIDIGGADIIDIIREGLPVDHLY
jgi:hypothetical protein